MPNTRSALESSLSIPCSPILIAYLSYPIANTGISYTGYLAPPACISNNDRTTVLTLALNIPRPGTARTRCPSVDLLTAYV
jgi:hypothetical protein